MVNDRKEGDGISRRGFILTSGAFAASALPSIRALAGIAGAPRLTLGVVSDIHLGALSSAKWGHIDEIDFRSVLECFRAAGVDGVVIPGDLASQGLRCDLDLVARIWYEVFPDNRLPDGRKVEKLFVTGNHDWNGYIYGKDEIAKAYPDETIRKANYLASDISRHWRECFHEEYAPVWMKEVKGYRFVGVNWVCHRKTPEGDVVNEDFEAFLAAHADELKGDRPFFYIQHPHPKDTCYGPKAWGRDNGLSTRLLSQYPNAVALSGHSHYSLADDQSVWQGAFTSIGCGSLACTERPLTISDAGDENGDTPKGDAKRKLMQPHTQYRNVQCMVMRVYDDRLVIERRRPDETATLGPDWIVPVPARTDAAQAFVARRQKEVPQFAAGTRVTVETGDTLERGGEPRHVVMAVFPPAVEGPRALRYDVAVVTEKGEEVQRKTVLADGFHRAPDPRRMNRVPFDCDTLPKVPWHFAVYPRNSWGRAGRPILTQNVR